MSAGKTSSKLKTSEKAGRICEILDQLYPNPEPPLHHKDAFTLLVAVVLSAQTTDKKVNEITPDLFARASTPEEMAQMSSEAIFQFIRQVSFAPTKSKNLKRMCELLVERHGGKIPDDMEALERLPGVGHKSASVVISQWFHRPAFPVDTHIHRLAARWGLSSGKDVVTTENDLKKAFPPETWIRLHMQMIYFGRGHCPALRHDSIKCPICSWAARRTKTAKPLKARKAQKKAKRR